MYLFLDTETTGLEPDKNAVIQLAAMVVTKTGDSLGEYCSRVRPFDGAIVEGGALAVSRRKFSDLLDAPTEVEVCLKLRELVGSRELVFAGYNCQFDQKFIWKMFQRTSVFVKYVIPEAGPLDVLKDAKRLLKKPEQVENHKLTTVAKYFGVLRDGAHDALEDVRMTRDVWRHLERIKQELKTGKR